MGETTLLRKVTLVATLQVQRVNPAVAVVEQMLSAEMPLQIKQATVVLA